MIEKGKYRVEPNIRELHMTWCHNSRHILQYIYIYKNCKMVTERNSYQLTIFTQFYYHQITINKTGKSQNSTYCRNIEFCVFYIKNTFHIPMCTFLITLEYVYNFWNRAWKVESIYLSFTFFPLFFNMNAHIGNTEVIHTNVDTQH